MVNGLGRGCEPTLQDHQRETNGPGALVVLERLGAVELLANVVGDFLVEASLWFREFVRNGVRDALGKERCAVELEQPLLDHAPHQVGDVGLVHAIAEATLEAVAVEQRHKELEVLFLSVVRRGRHQEEVARQRREELAQPVALRVLDLATEEGRGELVRFVANHEVPPATFGLELLLNVLVARQLVEAGDDQVVLEEPVAGPSGLELVVGENVEGKLKAAVELVLPLLREAPGADD